jgi:hypothetical protein
MEGNLKKKMHDGKAKLLGGPTVHDAPQRSGVE